MKLYMLGNGGHAHELFDQLFLEKNIHNFEGFIILIGDKAFVISETGIKPFTYEEDAAFVVATQNPLCRTKLIKHFTNRYESSKSHFPNVYSSKAHLSRTSLLGIGNVLSAFSAITGISSIGNFNSFSSYSSVHNNCKIGNYNILHSYTGIMNNCAVGDNNILQPNCIITEKVVVGDNNLISAGECVFDNINNEELFQSGIILKKET